MERGRTPVSIEQYRLLLEADPALASLAKRVFRERDPIQLRGLVLVIVILTQDEPTSPESLALVQERLEAATCQARAGYSMLRQSWEHVEVESALKYAL